MRNLLLGTLLVLTFLLRPADVRPGKGPEPPPSTLRVAAAQMRSSRDLAENVARTKQYLRRCAAAGARVVVFPECSLTGYFEDVLVAGGAQAGPGH